MCKHVDVVDLTVVMCVLKFVDSNSVLQPADGGGYGIDSV